MAKVSRTGRVPIADGFRVFLLGKGRTMKGAIQIVCVAVGVVVILTGAGTGVTGTMGAGPVYEQMMDAQWLANNASFPSRTPALVSGGDVLRFAATGVYNRDYDVLLVVPLTQAGVLDDGATVTIDVSAVPVSADNDLKVGVTDGTSVIVFERSDNNSGMGRLLDGDRNGPWAPAGIQANLDYSITMFTNAGLPTEFSATITLGDVETSVFGTIGTSSSTATASRLILPDSPISLVLVADDDWEEYDINWINVSVVPEPGALALMTVAALAVIRRRRK